MFTKGDFVKNNHKSWSDLLPLKKRTNLLLVLIVALGFMLRIHRVGEDSFWYDEVGQVEAALQPQLVDTFNVVRSHAGAMPLDYIVTRLMTRISLSEKVIRFPAVIWGTLAIVIYYLLIMQLNIPHKKQIALLSALLIALSPVNIQYSQEARFYASLMFFYGLATFFLIKAVTTHSGKIWLAYLAFNIVGMYFHPYLIFTVITGFFMMVHEAFKYGRDWNTSSFRKNILFYITSCVLIVVAFLPGYLFFHTQDVYSYEFELTRDGILHGLGLKAIISNEAFPPFGYWHIALIIGVVAGIGMLLRYPTRYVSVILMLVSVIVQVCAIILLDRWNGYPFIPRQLAHLTPFVYLLFSMGFLGVILSDKGSVLRYAITLMILGGLTLAAQPYIELVYDYSKGGTREIAQAIIERYQPGEKVATIHAQHETVLRFYLSQRIGKNKSTLMTVSFENLEDLRAYINNHPEVRFVYLPRNTDADIRREISGLGFRLIQISEDTDFIFVRK